MTQPAQMVQEEAELDTLPDSYFYYPSSIKPKPSTVTPRATSKGVRSHKAILNRNAIELWRYLLSNLRPPQMAVQVSGYEAYGDGARANFCLSIDVSCLVIPQWSRIVTTGPDKGATISQALEKYTSTSYPFKEFRLKKVVLWGKDRMTSLITDLVKAAGYGKVPSEAIAVSFRMSDDEVVASASNWVSRAAHHKFVRCLCWATCLCVLFFPVWHTVRDSKKHRLECEYRMAVSADDFVAANSARIHSAVVRREKQLKPVPAS